MRAQFEAMGLAVIVVLVSLGMFLLILFSFNDQGDAPLRYEHQQLAQNMVDALLKTTIEDCTADYAAVIEDEMLYQQDICSEDSLTVMATAASVVLGATLEERNMPYNFTIREQGAEAGANVLTMGECNTAVADTFAPGRQLLRLYPSPATVEVILWLC